jgi:NADPH:quinone reductase-like Zn-dependent oxidoreductase
MAASTTSTFDPAAMETASMLAIVNTPKGAAPVELRQIPDPTPANNQALVVVHAFSLNRGELSSFARNKEG